MIRESYLPTSLASFDRMVGGLPAGSILGIYGPPAGGKSVLVLQLAFEAMKGLGGNALVLVTEPGGMSTVREWHGRFAERFGFDVLLVPLTVARDAKSRRFTLASAAPVPRKGQVLFAANVPTIRKLLALHGRGHMIEISSRDDKPVGRKDQMTPENIRGQIKRGGKFTLRPVKGEWADEVLDSPIGQWLQHNRVSFIAYDSITQPLKEFGSEKQNLPARASATSLLMIAAQELVQELDVVALAVAHQTKDPATVWSRPHATGGTSLLHNLKYLLRLTKFRSGKQKHGTVNELTVERHAGRLDDDDAKALIKLTTGGYVDIEPGAAAPAEPNPAEPTVPQAQEATEDA